MTERCARTAQALATGCRLERWQARRHAIRCARCAQLRDEIEGIANALGSTDALTDRQRRLWMSAAGEEPEERFSRIWRWRPVLVGAAASVGLAVVGAWWISRPGGERGNPGVIEGNAVEIAGLRGRVIALERELEEVRRMADLIEARREVDKLAERLVTRADESE